MRGWSRGTIRLADRRPNASSRIAVAASVAMPRPQTAGSSHQQISSGFFDAGDERAKIVQRSKAEEVVRGAVQYRAPAEVVVVPVLEAWAMPLEGLLSAPGPAVAYVPHNAFVGGEPSEVFSEGVLPGHER